MKKVVRTICLFRKTITDQDYKVLGDISSVLEQNGFEIQTKRICLAKYDPEINDGELLEKDILLGLGSVTSVELEQYIDSFIASKNKNITLDLSKEDISLKHVDTLFKIITENPSNTFNFTYGFNTPSSSPYFPSAIYEQDGFSVGLQPTDLAEGCSSLDEWLERMKGTWNDLNGILNQFNGYLGIDSSVAPIFEGSGSLVHFIKRIAGSFNESVITDIYTKPLSL